MVFLSLMIRNYKRHLSLKKLTVKKGQILQRIGDLNTKVYFVRSGLLRSYCIDAKGKEHIFMFAPEGWVIADYLAPELPGDLFIDALEDSVVIEKEKNYEDEHDMKRITKRMWVLQKRVIMMLSYTALQRYEHFIETYPDIAQRVPQRMIASYLGITPEALSTIKGDRLKKKR